MTVWGEYSVEKLEPVATLPIRPAIAADIAAILALEKMSVTAAHYSEQHYREIIGQGLRLFAANRPWTSGKKEGQSRLALVIEEDSQVKGFLIGRVLGTEWEVENVVIAKEARKRGLGTSLVGAFLRMARERGGLTVYLEVRESNAAACRLYEKCQFTETGRRRRYYRDPEEDAVVYALRLE
jgi:ribosomal-protein-alanine N-acetyltransferase